MADWKMTRWNNGKDWICQNERLKLCTWPPDKYNATLRQLREFYTKDKWCIDYMEQEFLKQGQVRL